MANKLNLASKPFSNRALPWVVTTLLVLLSVSLLAFVVPKTGQANAQAYSLQRDIDGLNQQEQLLQKQAEEVKRSFTASQLQILRSAHELVDRKRFSWSGLFADLEAALPGDVRVTRISVRDLAARSGRAAAELDLVVVSKTASSVTDMVADMDRGGIFQAELRSETLQKGRGQTGTEYEIYLRYTPRGTGSSSADQSSSIASAERLRAAGGGFR